MHPDGQVHFIYYTFDTDDRMTAKFDAALDKSEKSEGIKEKRSRDNPGLSKF